MSVRKRMSSAALIVGLAGATAEAQKPPAVRALGKIERVSTDSLASVATALPMPGGRVMIHDITSRRVLMLDSTLAKPVVIADTTGATANAYGARPGSLIRYRGDTALFIDQSSLSMLVLGPTGAIVRVMAIPRPDDAQSLTGGPFGRTGLDARGRMVYFKLDPGQLPGVLMLDRSMVVSELPPGFRLPNADSAFIVRLDPATRILDTAASIRIPRFNRSLKADDRGYLISIETVPDVLPVVDDWTTMPDGSIAVVRGRDYHVDWLNAEGHWSSGPKMPFDWQHVDDEHKQALIDSAVTAWQTTFDKVAARQPVVGGGGGGNHMVKPKPYISASAPASIGATVAPMTSPTSVAKPIDVARNCEGTLSVGTSTMMRLAMP